MNKVMLMGRLTRDPELTMTPNEVSIAKFGLAVDRRFQKQGEERQADFFNIVCFRSTADFVKKYFVKGQLVAVSGSLQTRTWEKDGKNNYTTEIIADDVYFTGDRRDQNDSQNTTESPTDTYSYGLADDTGFVVVDDDQLPF